MTLTNTTGKALGEVQPFLLVSSAEDVDRPYWELETEYRDAKTGRWKTFHDAAPEDLFGFFAVGPRSAVTLQLRTRVVKDAKPGAGYALAAGDYRNRDGSCGSTKEAWYDFTVLPRGAKPTQPATTEPGEPGGTAEPSHSAAPASQAAPAAEIPTCYDVSNGQYRNNALVGRSFGIPKSIPLGTQWTTYTATLTNASVKELKSLELRAKLGSYVYNEGERDLSPYGDLQYWDASQRAWKTLRQADGNAGGSVPGPKTLKPRESVHVQLRFRVSKDLPLDQTYDAFTGLTGTFVDRYRDTDCTSHGDADGGFYPRKG
ncbi:hypothetical protein [Streptomyces sioyaensis]|uniref:hypothetical protein n=1 Tax=Streptomyces sioyaensis TaxID=67364 RepID=UPI003787EC28